MKSIRNQIRQNIRVFGLSEIYVTAAVMDPVQAQVLVRVEGLVYDEVRHDV